MIVLVHGKRVDWVQPISVSAHVTQSTNGAYVQLAQALSSKPLKLTALALSVAVFLFKSQAVNVSVKLHGILMS